MDTRKESKKQEQRIAKLLRGRRTANSGAGTFDKGDVKTKHMLIEAKTVTAHRVNRTIERKWLDKLEEQAFSRGYRMSALAFDYGDGQDYYILNQSDFLELFEAYERLMEIEEDGGED